jgi:hypothetical protein
MFSYCNIAVKLFLLLLFYHIACIKITLHSMCGLSSKTLFSRIVIVNGTLRVFGPRRGKVKESWRMLHNEEFHYLHSSPSTIRMIKSSRMRWLGHVARMGGRELHIRYWLEN